MSMHLSMLLLGAVSHTKFFVPKEFVVFDAVVAVLCNACVLTKQMNAVIMNHNGTLIYHLLCV
jgi:hypothetical protein